MKIKSDSTEFSSVLKIKFKNKDKPKASKADKIIFFYTFPLFSKSFDYILV